MGEQQTEQQPVQQQVPPASSPAQQPDLANESQTAGQRSAIDVGLPPNYALGFAAFIGCLMAVLLSYLLIGVFAPCCLVAATIVWMGVDVSGLRRDGYHVPGFRSPGEAVAAGILIWIVALPAYIVARDKLTRALEGLGVQIGGLQSLFVYGGLGLGLPLMLHLVVLCVHTEYQTQREYRGERTIDRPAAQVSKQKRSALSPAAPDSRLRSPVAAPNRAWRLVASWSGEGIKSTPKFTVGDEWAIEWATQPGQYGEMNFQIYTYSGDGELSDVDANIIGAGSDTSYKHRSGSYYLEVNSGQPWQIKIWDK